MGPEAEECPKMDHFALLWVSCPFPSETSWNLTDCATIGVKQLNSAGENLNVCKWSSLNEIKVWQWLIGILWIGNALRGEKRQWSYSRFKGSKYVWLWRSSWRNLGEISFTCLRRISCYNILILVYGFLLWQNVLI